MHEKKNWMEKHITACNFWNALDTIVGGGVANDIF